MGDPNWSNVVLLLGFEGSDGATGSPGMTDESPSAHGTATVSGNAQIDTAQFKFGSSSLLSDGSGDGLTFANSSDWNLSSANSSQFTIELFARITTTTPTNRALVWCGGSVGTLSFAFWVETTGNGQLAFWGSTSGSSFNWTVATTGLTWATGTWYHLAVDKDSSGKVRLYRDGVMLASATPASSILANSTQPLRVGMDGGSGRSWPGWIDEVRVTKGIARYASDTGFTVPTAAFPRGADVTSNIAASQLISAFSQSSTLTVDDSASANQSIPAFDQVASLIVLNPRSISGDQTIPAFGQSAVLTTATLLSISQTIPAFTQSVTLTVECVIAVDQTIPAFSQAVTLRRGDATPGLIFRGVIGGCSINRAGLATLEARSILTLGRGFLSERFCQQCRTDLYGARCKVDNDSFSASATVASVSGQFKFVVTALPDVRATGTWYDLGQAVITSGDSDGTPFQIKTWTSGTLTVEAMVPIDQLLSVGDTLTLYAGCDKSSTTCRDKFSNIINYRGEEYAAARDLQLTTAGG
jgi:hypothetical protein